MDYSYSEEMQREVQVQVVQERAVEVPGQAEVQLQQESVSLSVHDALHIPPPTSLRLLPPPPPTSATSPIGLHELS